MPLKIVQKSTQNKTKQARIVNFMLLSFTKKKYTKNIYIVYNVWWRLQALKIRHPNKIKFTQFIEMRTRILTHFVWQTIYNSKNENATHSLSNSIHILCFSFFGASLIWCTSTEWYTIFYTQIHAYFACFIWDSFIELHLNHVIHIGILILCQLKNKIFPQNPKQYEF